MPTQLAHNIPIPAGTPDTAPITLLEIELPVGPINITFEAGSVFGESIGSQLIIVTQVLAVMGESSIVQRWSSEAGATTVDPTTLDNVMLQNASGVENDTGCNSLGGSATVTTAGTLRILAFRGDSNPDGIIVPAASIYVDPA